MALSDSYLRSVHGRPTENVFVKADRDGLSVRVSKNGKVVFQLRYRIAGKQKRVDLGAYPGMSLKEARERAIILRRSLEEGYDPAITLKEERLSNAGMSTVEEVIRGWVDVYAKNNIKNYEQISRSFEIHIFPKIGAMPHDRVGTHTWLGLLESISVSSPAIAKRILGASNQAHAWAHRRRIVAEKPLSGVKPLDIGIRTQPTKRVLTDDEIRMLFDATDSMPMTRKNVLFIRLVLLFGCRTGELAAAKVSDFDFDNEVWTVPPENHKTGKRGKPLLRPIISAAREMIEEAAQLNGGSEFLFVRKKGYDSLEGKPLNSGSFLSVPNSIINFAEQKRGFIMPHWSMHDLRRTARTRWSVLAPPHVCEIMLGHTLPGIWSVYDHNSYLDEQRKAYSLWWASVMKIVHGESVAGLSITG